MYAIVDIETTGGAARYERITEIAIVLHDGEKVEDTFSTLINPERSIPWNITQITGITDEMVADAPRFFEVAKQIVQLTEGRIFVAHNVSFDYNFIKEEFARLGYEFSRRQLCTVRLSRKVFPGLPSYSLSNLKRHFNIHAVQSHRALDDTLATTQLFERILSEQHSRGEIRSLVNQGVKATRLPANLSIDHLYEAPEKCGVYYLHDQHGKVIYVGKSLNIRKRLFEHFADQTPKGEKMRQGVSDISWEVLGSELVALLFESAEIKRLQPVINRALRQKQYLGAIYTYLDAQGYQRLAIGKKTAKNIKTLTLVSEYPKLDHARNHLQSIVRQFELCYRLSHLDASESACFHYNIKQCKGACIGIEPPADYNERVSAALAVMNKRLSGNLLIVDKGRSESEYAVVGVLDGEYAGFGFIDSQVAEISVDQLLETLRRPTLPDPAVHTIIHHWTEGKKGLKAIRF